MIRDYDSFVSAFKSTFLLSLSKPDKLKAMMTREKGQRESIQDYFNEKVWLCTKLNFSVNKIRNEVAAGLWSREAASHLLVQSFESTDDILKELMHFQSVDNRPRNRVQRSGIKDLEVKLQINSFLVQQLKIRVIEGSRET